MGTRPEAIAGQHYYEPDVKEIGFRMVYVLYEAGGQLTTQRLVDILADHFQISTLWEYDDSREAILYHKWYRAIRSCIHKMKTWGFIENPKTWGDSYPTLTNSGRQLGNLAAKFYDQGDVNLPDWAQKFLSPLQKRIDGFLKGGSSRAKPNEIELCRWVNFCYKTKQYSKISGLFCAVLKDRVPEEIYLTAERQARVAQIELSEEKDFKLSRDLLKLLEKQYRDIEEDYARGIWHHVNIGLFYFLMQVIEKTIHEKVDSTEIELLNKRCEKVDKIVANCNLSKEELLAKVKENLTRSLHKDE